MKNFLFFFAVVSLSLFSCKKDQKERMPPTENLTPQNATVIAAGTLLFASKASTGSVKIYKQPNGKFLLGLEGMNLSAEHSLVVYLSGTPSVSASTLKICSVALLQGNVFRELPADFDPSQFKYLTIQTEPWEETVASAEFK